MHARTLSSYLLKLIKCIRVDAQRNALIFAARQSDGRRIGVRGVRDQNRKGEGIATKERERERERVREKF